MNKKTFWVSNVLLFSFLVLIAACSNEFSKNGKTDYWLKHQYKLINYIDTSKLDAKTTECIIAASTQKMRGNYAMAILDYYQALRFQKDTTAAVLYAIADCYNKLNKYDLAIEYAIKSLKIETDFLPAYEILVKAYISKHDLKNAIIALEKAVAIEKNEELLFNLAKLYEYQNIEKAKEIYWLLVEEYNNEDVFGELIEISKYENNEEQYILLLEKLWEKSPSNFLISMELALAWISTNNFQKFIDNIVIFDTKISANDLLFFYKNIITKIILINKSNNNSNDRNDATFEDSRISEIMKIFEFEDNEISESNKISKDDKKKILEKIDNRFRFDSQLNFWAGTLAITIPDTLMADMFFKRAIEALDTSDGISFDELRISIVLLYLEYDFQEKSKKMLIDFHKENPTFWGYPYMLGMFERQSLFEKNANIQNLIDVNNQKQHINQKALNYFNIAYKLDSSQIEVLLSLGDIYSEIEDYTKSDYFYEKALLLDSNNPNVCNNYAFSLSNRNKELERALQLAKKAINYNPNSAEYLDTYGWIYFKLGDYNKALEFVKKSSEINSQNYEVFGHLTDIYLVLKDFSEAKRALDKALEIAPFDKNLLNKRNLLNNSINEN